MVPLPATVVYVSLATLRPTARINRVKFIVCIRLVFERARNINKKIIPKAVMQRIIALQKKVSVEALRAEVRYTAVKISEAITPPVKLNFLNFST